MSHSTRVQIAAAIASFAVGLLRVGAVAILAVMLLLIPTGHGDGP